jgi:hypothetical protein
MTDRYKRNVNESDDDENYFGKIKKNQKKE